MTEHDFSSAWKTPISETEWSRFLEETSSDPVRFFTYDWFKSLTNEMQGVSLAEVGFGQCTDFIRCFKELHDNKLIYYSGYDVTEQFVCYAKRKFPSYTFEANNFFDPQHTEQYDIVYVRHVLEHQPPEQSYPALETLLNRAKRLCVIAWFVSPGVEETFQWIGHDGLSANGAYVNRLSDKKVLEIINKHNFHLEIQHFNKEPLLYILRRKQ